MATKEFNFATSTAKDIKNQQAIIALDNDVDTEILIKTLKSNGIRILGKSKDGNEALEMVRKFKVGMFFLDYDINILGSNAILESIKVKYPNLKMIVLAIKLDKQQVSDARVRGVVGFLAKPLTDVAIKKMLLKI